MRSAIIGLFLFVGVVTADTDGQDTAARFKVALRCEIQGHKARALRHYRAVLKIDPSHPAAARACKRLAPQRSDLETKSLRRLLWDKDPAVRRRSMNRLTEDSRALRIATRNPHADVRLAAVKALSGQEEARNELVDRALLDRVDAVRVAAAESLRAGGADDRIEPFVRALRSSSEAIRIRGAEALGRLGDVRGARYLRLYGLGPIRARGVYIARTRQIAFIQDFDTEIA